jgi:hypothetical protein
MGRLSMLVTFVRETCAREKRPIGLAEVCKFMNRDPRTIKEYAKAINELYEDVRFDGDSFDVKVEIPRKFDLKQKELFDFV